MCVCVSEADAFGVQMRPIRTHIRVWACIACALSLPSHTGYCTLDQSYKPLWARRTPARLLQRRRRAAVILLIHTLLLKKKKIERGSEPFLWAQWGITIFIFLFYSFFTLPFCCKGVYVCLCRFARGRIDGMAENAVGGGGGGGM